MLWWFNQITRGCNEVCCNSTTKKLELLFAGEDLVFWKGWERSKKNPKKAIFQKPFFINSKYPIKKRVTLFKWKNKSQLQHMSNYASCLSSTKSYGHLLPNFLHLGDLSLMSPKCYSRLPDWKKKFKKWPYLCNAKRIYFYIFYKNSYLLYFF